MLLNLVGVGDDAPPPPAPAAAGTRGHRPAGRGGKHPGGRGRPAPGPPHAPRGQAAAAFAGRGGPPPPGASTLKGYEPDVRPEGEHSGCHIRGQERRGRSGGRAAVAPTTPAAAGRPPPPPPTAAPDSDDEEAAPRTLTGGSDDEAGDVAAVATALAARDAAFGGGGDGGDGSESDGGETGAVAAAVAAAGRAAPTTGRAAKRKPAPDLSSSSDDDDDDENYGFGDGGGGDGLARAAARAAAGGGGGHARPRPPAKKRTGPGAPDAPPAAPRERPRAGDLVHAADAAMAAADEGGGGPSPPPPSWQALGVSPATAAHLAALGFAAPTPVQAAVIPALLAGRDALVRAPTGSGKTLAFLVPLVDALAARRAPRAAGTRAVVLLPTRELATQVGAVLAALLRRYAWLVGGTLGGGENRAHEKARLRRGVAVVVATPGRLLDHLTNTASFKSDACAWLVLDEADRLLDLGFEGKVAAIAAKLGGGGGGGGGDGGGRRRQTVLLSATADARVAALGGAARLAPDAHWVGALHGNAEGDGANAPSAAAAAAAAVGRDGRPGTAAARAAPTGGRADLSEVPATVAQRAVLAPLRARMGVLAGLLLSRTGADGAGRRHPDTPDPDDAARPPVPPGRVLVFFSSCAGVEAAHALLTRGVSAATARPGEDEGVPLLGAAVPLLKLHGSMPQRERAAAFLAFARARGGAALLATDVAARGLDFPRLAAVINADPPTSVADYAHRVGRAGRAGAAGEAVTLLTPAEAGYLGLLADAAPPGAPPPARPDLDALAAVAPLERLSSLPPAPPLGRRPRYADEAPGVRALAAGLARAVAGDAGLKAAAAAGFAGHCRAYATHPASSRSVFHPRSVHLGHLAHSFGFKDPPSLVGRAGGGGGRGDRGGGRGDRGPRGRGPPSKRGRR